MSARERVAPTDGVEPLGASLVDLDGFEPSTSSMPWKRAPNCATGPLEQYFFEDITVKWGSLRKFDRKERPEILFIKSIDSYLYQSNNHTGGMPILIAAVGHSRDL